MPFDSLNSPLPTDLAGECRKASKILNSFIDPGQGVDKIIPPSIIQNAKGLAIFTVIKAGFLFSGRAGSGLVVARLPEGGWSAPSAIGTGGMGFGGQVGAEITDFVIVLNNREAIKTFSHGGSVTLGGNLSVAAGPIGRNAEASGAATYKHVAALYSYSKTKGLFAGVSIEGSIIIERTDANAKFYGKKVSAKELLNGTIPPPPQADILYRSLDSIFHRLGSTATMYHSHSTLETGDNAAEEEGEEIPSRSYGDKRSSYEGSRPRVEDSKRASLPQQMAAPLANEAMSSLAQRKAPHTNFSSTGSVKRPVPPPPKPTTAVAMYDFAGELDSDLSFTKGDIIVITKKSDSQNDWWEGKCNGRSGMFPANYVRLQ